MSLIDDSLLMISAPMATLTHAAFRSIVEQFGGVDEYYSEMINAGTFLTNGPFEKYYIIEEPAPNKMVWQITGRKIEHIVQAAERIVNLRGIGLDINMGCSAPEIVRSGAGVSWMSKDIQEVRDLIKELRNVIFSSIRSTSEFNNRKRLSVKLRLGPKDFTDASFFSFCDMLVEEGVTRLTLHPRTSSDSYRVSPRYSYVEALASRYKCAGVSVILNGDVKDFDSFKTVRNICPNISGMMIARQSVIEPWIFAKLKMKCQSLQDKLIIDREKLTLDFVDLLEKYQPKEFWKSRLQRFFSYYCTNFSFAHYFRSKMINSKDLIDARNQIKDYFIRQPSDKIIVV
ncbi:MAG: tRNA-dihydrouridine synthase family protein [Treponema sp.]|nr:tRNA-dihydrouridine synthase family protein [Treponema sp.]